MSTRHTRVVAPSILAGDHAHLADSLKEAETTPNVSWLHIDIMDGHFVPNLTFGPKTVQDLRPHSKLFFDVHLMLANPDRHIDAFIKAGADNVTIHAEPHYAHAETLHSIREQGAQCGISINPDTPAEVILPYLDHVDLVLLMTVQPGFGGQAFRDDVLEKISLVNEWRCKHHYPWRLEVDGGVDLETGKQCLEAGADTLVAGTAFFKAADRLDFVQRLQE